MGFKARIVKKYMYIHTCKLEKGCILVHVCMVHLWHTCSLRQSIEMNREKREHLIYPPDDIIFHISHPSDEREKKQEKTPPFIYPHSPHST
jgi:hypothetical protein